MSHSDLVVTGIGVVTPAASSAEEAAGTTELGLPPADWFHPKLELGSRGFKYFPAPCQYLLAAGRRAVADAGDGLGAVPEELRVVAVGTNSGAAAVHADFDRTIIDAGADDLSPASAPFFSINLFGSRLGMDYGVKGCNITFTSPRVAALQALEFAARSARLGRAEWLMVGATEGPLEVNDPCAGESESGAVVLVLEPQGAAIARGARIRGACRVHTAYLPSGSLARPPGRTSATLRNLAARLGARAGTSHVVAVLDDSAAGCRLAQALDDDVRHVPAGAGCLEPMLRIAALLANGEEEELVVTVAPEGNLAVAAVTPEVALAARETPSAGTGA